MSIGESANGRIPHDTQWANILDAHATSLHEQEDPAHFDTAVWLLQQSVSHASDILTLLQLAQSLKLILTPVKPRAQFRADLRQELEQASLTTIAKRSLSRLIWPIAAIVGSILSIIVLLRRWRGVSLRPGPMRSAV